MLHVFSSKTCCCHHLLQSCLAFVFDLQSLLARSVPEVLSHASSVTEIPLWIPPAFVKRKIVLVLERETAGTPFLSFYQRIPSSLGTAVERTDGWISRSIGGKKNFFRKTEFDARVLRGYKERKMNPERISRQGSERISI